MESTKRWLVVTTTGQERYVGHCEEQSEELQLGRPVTLTEVWEFINHLEATGGGLGRISILLPPNGLRPLKKLMVTPSSWYDINEEGMTEEFKKLIAKAEEPLQRARAREAGIALPGDHVPRKR